MRSSSRSPVRVDLPPLPVLLMRATLLTRPVSPSGCRGLTGRFEPIEPAFLDGIVTRGEIAADIETINRCIDDGTSCSRWAWLPLLGVPVAFIGSIFTLINQPTLSAGSAPSFDDTSQSMSWSSQIYWFAAFAVCGMAGMCGMMYGASELSRVLESAAGNACEEVTRKYSARRVLVRFSLRTQATLESYYDNGMGMGNGMRNGMGMGNQYGGVGNQYGGYSLRTRRLHFLVISRGAAPAIAGAIIEPGEPTAAAWATTAPPFDSRSDLENPILAPSAPALDEKKPGGDGIAAEIAKLAELRDQGILTADEFTTAKAKAISQA